MAIEKKSLVWDEEGKHYFETGVDHGVLYLRKDTKHTDAIEGTNYYAGVVWNGLTSVEESPDGGDTSDVYADNIKYFTVVNAEDYKGTINAYYYPDEFAECNGEAEPVPGMKLSTQSRRHFGFVYRTKLGSDELQDLSYKLHIVYNCVVSSPSSVTHDTINDSIDAVEMSWEFSTVPESLSETFKNDHNVRVTANLVIDESKFAEGEKATYLQTLKDYLFGKDESAEGAGDAITPQLLPIESVYAILTTGALPA